MDRKKLLAYKTAEAIKWLRDQIDNIQTKNEVSILKDHKPNLVSVFPKNSFATVGRLWMFIYDPITKKKLPYWDRFPLVLVLKMSKNSILGLNFHYLPLRLRFLLFDKLVRKTININNQKKIVLTPKMIRDQVVFYKECIPCIKRYRFRNIRSKILFIPDDQWIKTLALPTQRFRKSSPIAVWNQSRRKITDVRVKK